MWPSVYEERFVVTGIGSDYGILSELLDRSGSPVPLAELHGSLCGVICASGRRAAESWLDDLITECAGDAGAVSELGDELRVLGNDTWQALNGSNLEFSPLLPDDQSRVEQRVEALALWCHGFLAGLVVGGLEFGRDGELPDELQELVRDFAEISKAGASPEEIDDGNFSDNALVELEEYVRIGAQLVFEELTPVSGTEAQRTIH
jgi:uncharacterized protein YgfB (UPF0149 family)